MALLLNTLVCMRSMSDSANQECRPAMTDWQAETICQTLEDIGFENIDVHELPHDLLSHLYSGTKLMCPG